MVIFPELSLTGYHLRDMVSSVALADGHPILSSLLELSRDIAIVLGYVEESPDFQFYNTAALLDGGEMVRRHRKVYLPTYGMFEEERYFSPGRRFEAFDTRLGRVGLLVCEDALHPVSLFLLALDGAETIVILSASPGRGIGKEQQSSNIVRWEELLQSYGHVFTAFTVFANRVGYEDGVSFWGGSRVIGPDGSLVTQCNYFEEGSADAELSRQAIRSARITNPYLRDEKIEITLSELERIWDERTLHQ